MPLGQVLYESGGTLSHVYFPITAIVSLLYVMESGASAEIAVVGKEGIVGISLFMGRGSTSSRAVVQSAGHGYRLKASIMKGEFDRAGAVLHLLLRYTQALITQMAQTAVSNRHHSLDQQSSALLLLSLDRLQGSELVMTQELIANMLGVRREGVTEAALKLQRAGLIHYVGGHIHRAGPEGIGGARLRMLCSGEEGVRPPSSGGTRDLSERGGSPAHFGGGSFMTSQYRPSCWAASRNWGEVHGLAHEAVGAQIVARQNVLLLIARSQHHHGNSAAPVVGAQAAQHLEAADLRQFEIEQNHLRDRLRVAAGVRPGGEYIVERLDAVGDDHDFVENLALAEGAQGQFTSSALSSTSRMMLVRLIADFYPGKKES